MASRVRNIWMSLAEATEDSRRPSTTSDDISNRVTLLLDEVRTTILTFTENGRVEIACNLVIRLQQLSYGERDSDPVADDLLIELANERKAASEEWDLVSELRDLEERHDYLKGYGIETYSPKLISMCKMWGTKGIP
ncbi:uncharacterized protein M421DRAFT_418066 [Didymella exigua CBS 183.55]|uniref:Uncharacterized protein n=1 Tax=Didymella exigua CBS 183.55 TaxID=1150837 RepID=A0A6A5RSK5_9PLEO|nr:uncharacterized protein M421DRAFT_418066 [Didymella exigua CBS 183.55]KAF1931431.1 hypothetical protein M421DRAFT_418066 [Didymella exigua CBS 183.55]